MKLMKVFLFLCATMVETSALFLNQINRRTQYGVLCDAGSTSTKLKVYSWTSPRSDASVPDIELIHNEKFKPGFSAFENDLAGMRTYLEGIIEAAVEVVPDREVSEVPIYILATAGLRLLQFEEAGDLVTAIRELLADDSFNPFSYTSDLQVQILSGEEEAVYAWIAANYLSGYFDSYKPYDESVGVMEMGGGSTQIAFIPKDPLLSEEFQVTVAKRLYSVYAQSYLQYGSDAVLEREAFLLVKDERIPSASDAAVDDPCRLEGDTLTLVLKDRDDQSVTLQGTSDASACKPLVQRLVESDTGYNCVPKPCAVGSVYQPSVDGIHFYATSAFVYTPSDLGVITKNNNLLDINALESNATAYCINTLQDALDAGADAKYASSRCFMGLYIPALLDVYGFNRTVTSQITVSSEINGKDIDWALGAMLQLLSTSFTGQSGDYSVKKRRR